MIGRLFAVFTMVLLLAGCGEYEEREREVGYKGLAKINHLLAAERLAQRMGLKAASYGGAPSLPPPEGTILILPAESLQSEGQLEEITDWVVDGGSLIVYLTLQNKRAVEWSTGEDEEEAFQPFLEYFGFEAEIQTENGGDDESWGKRIESVSFDGGEPYETNFRSPYLISDTDFPLDGAKAFLSYDYGDGMISIFGSGQLFTNEHLGKGEHATLLWDLLEMGNGDQVWMIHSTRLSFFKLLWEQAPQATIFLLVTLALLVWWAARGFGPKFVRGTNPSAKLDEHLEASGAFFLKHRADVLIVSHLRDRLFRRVARATNQPLNMSGGDLIPLAVEQGVLSANESAALTELPSDKNLLTILQTLKNLDKKL